MKCPCCNQEMENGYLTSDARAIAWREENYESAVVRKGNGIQLSRHVFGAATIANAYCCKSCEKILIDYSKQDTEIKSKNRIGWKVRLP